MQQFSYCIGLKNTESLYFLHTCTVLPVKPFHKVGQLAAYRKKLKSTQSPDQNRSCSIMIGRAKPQLTPQWHNVRGEGFILAGTWSFDVNVEYLNGTHWGRDRGRHIPGMRGISISFSRVLTITTFIPLGFLTPDSQPCRFSIITHSRVCTSPSSSHSLFSCEYPCGLPSRCPGKRAICRVSYVSNTRVAFRSWRPRPSWSIKRVLHLKLFKTGIKVLGRFVQSHG